MQLPCVSARNVRISTHRNAALALHTAACVTCKWWFIMSVVEWAFFHCSWMWTLFKTRLLPHYRPRYPIACRRFFMLFFYPLLRVSRSLPHAFRLLGPISAYRICVRYLFAPAPRCTALTRGLPLTRAYGCCTNSLCHRHTVTHSTLHCCARPRPFYKPHPASTAMFSGRTPTTAFAAYATPTPTPTLHPTQPLFLICTRPTTPPTHTPPPAHATLVR